MPVHIKYRHTHILIENLIDGLSYTAHGGFESTFENRQTRE